ncbi:MAG: hypothetical protein PHW24_01715 [Candidatus Moranbacteria bacterium]|nr:hypothetical protein [Candidatus Moranbacteria bacterium]
MRKTRKIKFPEEMQILGSFLFGFACYGLILFLILFCLKATGWSAFISIMLWTVMWLLFYTQHVANVAISKYTENEKIEASEIRAELKKDTDIFLG